MKKFSKHSFLTLVLTLVFVLGFGSKALAATTPSLGLAASFGILSSTYVNTSAGTVINGDLGYTTGPATAPTVNGTTHVANATYNQAGVDQATALANLNSQPCVSIGAIVALDSYDSDGAGPLPPGTFAPGCYSSTGAMNITVGTTVTLSGTGTFIFRPDGALTTGANSAISLIGGASACDVFWTPTGASSLGATSTFAGTDITDAGITIGNAVTWVGRALAFGGTVSTDSTTITVPTCTSTIPSGGSASTTTPGLPNAGVKPESKSSLPWSAIVSAGVIATSFATYLTRKRLAL